MTESATPLKTLVIGVGNGYRGDDGVGLSVARHLKDQVPSHVKVVEASGETTALMALWEEATVVILIDAVYSGASPGTIHRLDAQQQTTSTNFFRGSTHSFGVAEAIELARVLNQLPPHLLLYGIEAHHFEEGSSLSPEVEAAAKIVVEQILQDLLI
ncbi:MAG: hydrogenase maturation protease [Chloroflexota bacterium]|nr:hydrogenase maturation protease [Chloroflexota bacterium]